MMKYVKIKLGECQNVPDASAESVDFCRIPSLEETWGMTRKMAISSTNWQLPRWCQNPPGDAFFFFRISFIHCICMYMCYIYINRYISILYL